MNPDRAPTQEEIILNQIRINGGTITTYQLMDMHISQYQARLKSLREKLAARGLILTEAQTIEGQKKNFMYRLIEAKPKQLSLFTAAA